MIVLLKSMKTQTVRYEIPGAWWTVDEPIEPEGMAEWFDERAAQWRQMDLELDSELAQREQDEYEAAKQRGETAGL